MKTRIPLLVAALTLLVSASALWASLPQDPQGAPAAPAVPAPPTPAAAEEPHRDTPIDELIQFVRQSEPSEKICDCIVDCAADLDWCRAGCPGGNSPTCFDDCWSEFQDCKSGCTH